MENEYFCNEKLIYSVEGGMGGGGKDWMSHSPVVSLENMSFLLFYKTIYTKYIDRVRLKTPIKNFK